ncbi:hypothetical protein LZ480_06180 [Solibacillus sp. MA9]|uniref:Uncharacterized protein n=1 Tax=Solibacillus palustris TaxID=2908203 RepID=A0ABS9UB81_9BACL|nr:hypothetical protein [Solibacillus sp. MA9]MCH7321478.1 hypothetical protein [Solibacillus sp. MA9]
MEWQQLQLASENYKLQLLEAEKLHKKQTTVERLMKHSEREIARFELDMQQARKALNKLEQSSFINLFRNWSGKQDELIEQNLDQIAVTELKLIEAQLTLEDLQDDVVDIVLKLNAINEPYIEQELQKLNNEKQQWLTENAPQFAEKLTFIAEQQTLCKQLTKEIQEAIDAGNTALSALTDAGYALHEAESYSTWDTFLGGGFIATAMKHEKLETTNSYIHTAQMALQRFSNELLDVKDMRNETIEIGTEGFVKFTDFFFDNIFTDWSVHSKITTAMNQISRVQDDVANTLRELQQKLTVAIKKEAELFSEREAILNSDESALFFEK